MCELRSAFAGDLPALYRVALATGDGGGDATHLHRDPDLIGHVFVGPYIALDNAVAFTAVDDDGVLGYALGTPDTRAFEAERERRWFPPLRDRYSRVDRGRLLAADRAILGLIDRPEPMLDGVVGQYPAHLHIDLLPRGRSRGFGRRFMGHLLAELSERGAPGVHLEVDRRNERAIAFYVRLGFDVLATLDDSFVMVAPLRPA